MSLAFRGPAYAVSRLKQMLRYWRDADSEAAAWFNVGKLIDSEAKAAEFFVEVVGSSGSGGAGGHGRASGNNDGCGRADSSRAADVIDGAHAIARTEAFGRAELAQQIELALHT